MVSPLFLCGIACHIIGDILSVPAICEYFPVIVASYIGEYARDPPIHVAIMLLWAPVSSLIDPQLTRAGEGCSVLATINAVMVLAKALAYFANMNLLCLCNN